MKELFDRGLAFGNSVWGAVGGSVEGVENLAAVAVDVSAAVVFKFSNAGLSGLKGLGPFNEGTGTFKHVTFPSCGPDGERLPDPPEITIRRQVGK